MGKNMVQKIMEVHLVSGRLNSGDEVRTNRSVAYIDHNTLQVGFESLDDHVFMESAFRKFGLSFSRARNGICHQVNLERFSVPRDTLLVADNHTTTGGGVDLM